MPTPARGSGRSPRSRATSGPGRGRDPRRTPQRRTPQGRTPQRRTPQGRTNQPRTTGRRPTAGGATRPAARPTPQPRRRSRLTGRSALLFVVLAVLLVSYASSMRAWFDQRAHINELEQQIATNQAKVERLTEEKRRWSDPAYVKAQARARFGYVMPGEVGYRVIGEDGEPLGGTVELTEPTPTPDDDGPAWWEQAWGSVEAAGADPDELEEDSPARFIGPKGKTR